MKELLEVIARHLVAHPDAVAVREMETTTAWLLELTVAKEDVGRIIGKRGVTVAAIRIVLNAASARINRRVVLEVIEPPV